MFRAHRASAALYVFSVAQIANLLYRRLQIGRALAVFRRPGQGAGLQDGILRYRRLAVCATNTTEALNRYAALAAYQRPVVRKTVKTVVPHRCTHHPAESGC